MNIMAMKNNSIIVRYVMSFGCKWSAMYPPPTNAINVMIIAKPFSIVKIIKKLFYYIPPIFPVIIRFFSTYKQQGKVAYSRVPDLH